MINNVVINHKYYAIHFVEDPKGNDWIWLLGDNFAATSYRKHFLLREDNLDTFIKKRFKHVMSCNSRFNIPTANMLVRLQNSFVSAFNNKNTGGPPLPKFILIVLDNDIISFLRYTGVGSAEMMGSWIQWLAEQLDSMIEI